MKIAALRPQVCVLSSAVWTEADKEPVLSAAGGSWMSGCGRQNRLLV